MKNWYTIALALLLLGGSITSAQTLLMEEYFNYPAGTLVSTLTTSGFQQRSTSGAFKQTISSKVLTYQGYAGSGIGKTDSLTADGDDFSRDFALYPGSGLPIPVNAVTSGSVYFAALVNVLGAGTTGDYFLSFHYNNTFNGKVFVQANGAGFSFATAKNTVQTYESTVRTFGTTYLVVVKYTFNPGTGDDRIDMWVNPALSSTEPTPEAPFANITETARNDYAAIGGVAIRQGGTSPAIPPKVHVGAIRVATEWSALLFTPPVGIEDEVRLPNDFELTQNYPNPFNPSTTINYSLPESGNVDISVFNVLGQKITTLHSGYESAGQHRLVWNAKNESGSELSSGIYITRVSYGGKSKSIKMMLMR